MCIYEGLSHLVVGFGCSRSDCICLVHMKLLRQIPGEVGGLSELMPGHV